MQGFQANYIGDTYPLCVDLPDQHFLKSGALYRLLGNTPYPELQKEQEKENWIQEENAVRFQANQSGYLYSYLCNATSGSCNYAPIVTLSADLQCTGAECDVDTIRTVEVGSGIFYEYVRPPCVHLAFYDNATKIRMRNGSDRTFMCADPRTAEASTICCDFDDNAGRFDMYWAERVRFSTAQARCSEEPSLEMCTSANIQDCDTYSCGGEPYYWTSESCQLKIKIRPDRRVAVVHSVPSEENAGVSVTQHVNVDTKTFFRVQWNDVPGVDGLVEECGGVGSPCVQTAGRFCLCDVSAIENQAFTDANPPTRTEVLALAIGAFKPIGLTMQPVVGRDGVWVYGSGIYSKESVFAVVDQYGKTQLRKNMRSTVVLTGATFLEFRTPVHFVSVAEETARDAMSETEAALDHYFYHPNTAPFLAIRFAQRFGLSNPTPRYVKAIANAFKDGVYTSSGVTFGTSQYGDLAATLAAVLLHDEARNVLLDADGFHGSFREPLLKVIQLMRSFVFQASSANPIPRLGYLEDTIQQMAFLSPGKRSAFPNTSLCTYASIVVCVSSSLPFPLGEDVFSFFQPGHVPYGIIGPVSCRENCFSSYQCPGRAKTNSFK